MEVGLFLQMEHGAVCTALLPSENHVTVTCELQSGSGETGKLC